MPFVPGLELSRRYHADVVGPLVAEAFPGLVHSVALFGPGSEVLGFDTARSTDHSWGPRLLVFLGPNDRRAHGGDLAEHLARRLPATYAGHPTRFPMRDGDPPAPQVTASDPGTWFTGRLGFDPSDGVTVADWLATPTQLLAEATGGAVFADGLGTLEPARARLAWYPTDVWRYVVACQWNRVSQEEPFVGRTGEVGDDPGSAVLAARLVRDLMRLALLLARRWPPYPKWLGTAFARLPLAATLAPHLDAALAGRDWRTREAALCRAYTVAAGATNALRLAAPVDPAPRPFHDRPFQVLGARRFTDALLAAVTDPEVRALPLVGAVDQVVDSADVLSHPQRARAAGLAALSLG